MRLVLVSIFLGVLSLSPTLAQGLAAGVKLGPTFSNLSGRDGQVNFDTKTGFTLGGFFEVAASDLFALQPEVNISFLGAKRQEIFTSQNESRFLESKLSITSVEIPLLAKFSTGYDVRIYGLVGPTLGIKIAERMKGEYRPAVQDGVPPADPVDGKAGISNSLVQNYFALTMGAGVVFENVVFDVRYNIGFTDVTESLDRQITPGDDKNRLSNLAITVGYIWIF